MTTCGLRTSTAPLHAGQDIELTAIATSTVIGRWQSACEGLRPNATLVVPARGERRRSKRFAVHAPATPACARCAGSTQGCLDPACDGPHMRRQHSRRVGRSRHEDPPEAWVYVRFADVSRVRLFRVGVESWCYRLALMQSSQ